MQPTEDQHAWVLDTFGVDPRKVASAVEAAAGVAGAFVKGVGEGAADGVVGMVKGTATLVRGAGEGAYALATDPQARARAGHAVAGAAHATGEFAHTAAADPGRAASQAGHAVADGARTAARTAGAVAHGVAEGYREAAAHGHAAEFIGKAVGQGGVLVAGALIPGVGEAGAAGITAEGVGAVARGAELGEAAGGLARAGETAEQVAQAGRAAEQAGQAGRAAERARSGATGLGEAAGQGGWAAEQIGQAGRAGSGAAKLGEAAEQADGAGRGARAGQAAAGAAPKIDPAKLQAARERLAPLLEEARAGKAMIDAAADETAAKFGGVVRKAPIKSLDRAAEKVAGDYHGDARAIKDLARNTVVVPPGQTQAVIDDIAGKMKVPGGVKRTTAESDPLGYSGVIINVEQPNGMLAEIQVNSPEMIYAKDAEDVAERTLGPSLFRAIKQATGLPGGRGHQFYEAHRILPPGTAERTEIAAESKRYYDAIRRSAANIDWSAALRDAAKE